MSEGWLTLRCGCDRPAKTMFLPEGLGWIQPKLRDVAASKASEGERKRLKRTIDDREARGRWTERTEPRPSGRFH